MARVSYELVGSTYDNYAFGNKYKNEEVIKIDGVSLSSLEEIDRFTCQETLFSISKKLPEHYQDKNQFSIRVTGKDYDKYYMHVIFDKPELVAVIDDLRKKDILTRDGYRRYKLVTHSHPLVLDTIGPIERAIRQKDRKLLEEVVKPGSNFSWKVESYFDSDYSEGAADEEIRNLSMEARNYSTFRSNLVYQMKKKESKYHYQVFPTTVYGQPLQLNRNNQVKVTISFPKFNEEGYAKRQTDRINQYGGQEEYLTPEEVDAAYGYNVTFEQVRSQEKRHGRS